MALIKILGDSFTIVSTLKAEDIQTLTKYAPKALKLISEEDKKSEIFGVGFNANSGSVHQFGITFNGVTADGFAYLTQAINSKEKTAEAKKAAVMEATGFAILSLNEVEEKAAAALENVRADVKTVNDSMTVVD